MIDSKGIWDDHLSLIGFASKNSYYSRTQIAPYKAVYRRRCITHIGWFELFEAGLFGQYLVHKAMEKVKVIQYRFNIAQIRQIFVIHEFFTQEGCYGVW